MLRVSLASVYRHPSWPFATEVPQSSPPSLLKRVAMAKGLSTKAIFAHGEFSPDDPQTEWRAETGSDRNMTLVRSFFFLDPKKKSWDVPAGYTIDGASIPRALWTLVGSPYTGDYRRASIPHDKACRDALGNKKARKAADRMFYHACRAGGCSVAEAVLLYLGVRLGSIMPNVLSMREMAADDVGPRLQLTAEEERLQADYRQIGTRLRKRHTEDDPEILETQTDEELEGLYGKAAVQKSWTTAP